MLSLFDQLLWAIIGLLLTISGVFIEVALPIPVFSSPLDISEVNIDTLGVTLQIGAVLFVGCMGGRNSGILSQFAYLLLGLSGLQVFAQGGGWSYVGQPTFGYLLGFMGGAWVCGDLAFKLPRKLLSYALSSLAGLGVIHLCGIVYFTLLAIIQQLPAGWGNSFLNYSFYPIPGQLAIVGGVAVLSYLLRRILMY